MDPYDRICQEHGREKPCATCRARNTPSKIVSVTSDGGGLVVLDDRGRLWRARDPARPSGGEEGAVWSPLLVYWPADLVAEWRKR